MPRNMSFSLTKEQIKNRTKDVTRRLGWWFLKPGDVLWAVEKAMGLKKGEKVRRLAKIRVVSVGDEPLWFITQEDVRREGFPDMTTVEFVEFFISKAGKGCSFLTWVNRIEFEYIDGELDLVAK